MQITSATRKPVEDLNALDLEAFPVWEFAIDEEGVEGQDETWVKPVSAAHIPVDGFSLSVGAALRFANGLVYPGVLFCDPGVRLGVAAVAILTTEGRVLFGQSDSTAEVRRELGRLGLQGVDVFPLQYCTRAPSALTGRYMQGVFDPSTKKLAENEL